MVNARIPTDRAHGIQIMKMCEAFASQGIQVELVVPRRINKNAADPFQYYGIKPIFKITKIPTIDLVWLSASLFKLQTLSFGLATILYLKWKRPDCIVYTRGEMLLFLEMFLSKKFPIFVETHIKPENFKPYTRAFASCDGIIVVTREYSEELSGSLGIKKEKILIAPDGVDIQKFKLQTTKEEARKKLNLPVSGRIVVYTGSDLQWKGLDTLKEACDYLSQNVFVYFIGNIKPCGKENGRMIFMGHQPYPQIPLWLAAADVLVLTGTTKSVISKNYTSPLKMFEYMAAGRPIVASDILSFRDVLNERNAILVKPDDPQALAMGIERAIEDTNLSNTLSMKASNDVLHYSWENRTRDILNFIETKISI